MDLDDKVVVITGGAQGLGLATAIRLAGKKPRIVLVDINPRQLAEARQVVEAAGATVSTWECNVSDEDAVDKIFDQINMHNGRLDAVINNAGVTRDALLLKIKEGVVEKRMSLKEWNQVIDVNLTGTFLCGRAAATEMVKAANGGCIINISSISRHGNMGQTNYTATKAGVAAMAVTCVKKNSRNPSSRRRRRVKNNNVRGKTFGTLFFLCGVRFTLCLNGWVRVIGEGSMYANPIKQFSG